MLTKIKNEDLSVPSIIYLQHSFLKYVLGYLYTLTRSRNPILKNKKKQRQPSRRTNVTIIRNSNGCWTAKSIIRRINQDLVGGKKLKKQNQDAASPWNKIFRVSRRVHYRITRWSQKGAEKNSKNWNTARNTREGRGENSWWCYCKVVPRGVSRGDWSMRRRMCGIAAISEGLDQRIYPRYRGY